MGDGVELFRRRFDIVLYLGIASQAGRFFVEAQRSGLIELLLATPLTVNSDRPRPMAGVAADVRSAGGAVSGGTISRRIPGSTADLEPPCRHRSLDCTVGGTLTNTTIRLATNITTVTTTTATGTTTVTVARFATPNGYVTLAMSVAGTLTVIANLAALSWFGMWMGLNSKNLNLATLKTIVFVQIIPWFGVSFASAMVVPLVLLPSLMKGVSSPTSQMMAWYPLITSGLATVLFLAKDIAFSFWARRKLYSEFRERAVQAVAPIRAVQPPPLAPTGTPPVITPT